MRETRYGLSENGFRSMNTFSWAVICVIWLRSEQHISLPQVELLVVSQLFTPGMLDMKTISRCVQSMK